MKFSTALAIIAATAFAAPIPQDASTSFTEQSVAKAAAKPVTAKPATGGSVASKPSTGGTSVWDKLDKKLFHKRETLMLTQSPKLQQNQLPQNQSLVDQLLQSHLLVTLPFGIN
ncbi:unnamed protein product [Ambrosiozyma monospora]|uniref:Unnamed protein product n=1 Tax=Ambrosiozyma monospora TaxID=43982 RepID=A0ACB5T331_AMBMO|nr:unnamed protein product [Ambrosiozyma monospora]